MVNPWRTLAATALAAVTAVAVFPYPSMGTEVPDDATVSTSTPTPEQPGDTSAQPAENIDDDPVFRLILQEERPVAPVPSPLTQPAPAMSDSARRLAETVDAGRPLMDLRDPSRLMSGRSTFANRISGREATERVATDAGNLLGKSPRALGTNVQQRTPIMSDPRVRGSRVGQLLASGSYWVPARMDLDTMLSKIDSRSIDRITVIPGPYTALYGPGFDFVDVDLLGAPRYEDGRETHGGTLVEYKTNGEQLYTRQSGLVGDTNWGARVDYGFRTGNDYTTGDPDFELPSSYRSGDLNAVIGWDPSDESRLEFRYLRQDQFDVEFPGYIFDINRLETNGYEVTYTLADQVDFDLLTVEAWHNSTKFTGDTFRTGKNTQIPTLREELFSPSGTSGSAITDVRSSSSGYSTSLMWGGDDGLQLIAGTDLRYLMQELNDIENQQPTTSLVRNPVNFPVPPSWSANPGLFAEQRLSVVDDRVRLKTGQRFDTVNTHSARTVRGRGESNTSYQNVRDLDREFTLFGVFGTAEYDVTDHWTASVGAGFAERPPTLTELYAIGSFMAVLQPGFTFVSGDADLDPERRTQVDIGLRGDYGAYRCGGRMYHAWINDYITYDATDPTPAEIGQRIYSVAFTNTDLATIAGFEAFQEYDMTGWMTGFATIQYAEGMDHSRNAPGRMASVIRIRNNNPNDNNAQRSIRSGSDDEPLPGFAPLESRVGVRVHEEAVDPRWNVELAARMVAQQSRVAFSLGERETSGFTTLDLRGNWKVTRNWSMFAGIENLTDRFYREHLDLRTGRGVFQPGISGYFGSELVY
jgi:iron complex outermembrane recepter protein